MESATPQLETLFTLPHHNVPVQKCAFLHISSEYGSIVIMYSVKANYRLPLTIVPSQDPVPVEHQHTFLSSLSFCSWCFLGNKKIQHDFPFNNFFYCVSRPVLLPFSGCFYVSLMFPATFSPPVSGPATFVLSTNQLPVCPRVFCCVIKSVIFEPL